MLEKQTDEKQTFRRAVVLEVPYAEKDEAKNLGAWWDPEIRKWFVPAGIDPAPFERWRRKSAEVERRSNA